MHPAGEELQETPEEAGKESGGSSGRQAGTNFRLSKEAATVPNSTGQPSAGTILNDWVPPRTQWSCVPRESRRGGMDEVAKQDSQQPAFGTEDQTQGLMRAKNTLPPCHTLTHMKQGLGCVAKANPQPW